MIVLHVGEYGGDLALWGEVSGDAPRRGRPGGASYKFGADMKSIEAALQQTSLDVELEEREAAVWLPTRGDEPVPSSGMISEPPPSRRKLDLKPWGIAAHVLSAEDSVSLLSAAAGRKILAPGVIVGADASYWADVLQFASSIVARQQFLPSLEAEGDQYRAAWSPVFMTSDLDQLIALAQRMPAAGRALSGRDSEQPPQRPSIEVLKGVVSSFADHLVRSTTSQSGEMRRKQRTNFESVHDAWLYALRSKHSELRGKPGEIDQLVNNLREWKMPVAVSINSPFRLCFRLEEPEGGGAGPAKLWYVRYLLQSNDDPSLLIPADEAWAGKLPKALRNSSVKEFLLISLGQASGISEGVAANLEGSQMSGHLLDTAGAHRFLTQEAVVLKQSGYGVMLPSWWSGKGAKAKLAARARVKSPAMQGGGGGLVMGTIFDFDWTVAMGDESLTVGELESLAKLKSPLVRFRGQWMEVDAEAIKSAIKFFKKGGRATMRELMQMNLGAGETPAGLEFGGIEADGWVAEMLQKLEGREKLEDLEQPGGFSGTLRPYQVRGFSWLAFLRRWGLGGCLADDMGLGKTIQILALLQRDWEAGERRPVLLICPTSVINNWQREAARFTPALPVMIHHGTTRKRDDSFAREAEKHAMVVSSYGLLQRDVELLKGVPWGGVVLDEAQNVKNPETKQAKAARTLDAEYRFALTGTPVENHVGDLWSTMEFLNPGLLGTQGRFKENFFVPIQMNRDRDAISRLKRTTGPFILRRLKTDKSVISDLPEKMEAKVFCSLTKEQASLYASVLEEAERELYESEGIKRRGIILGTISKLKQVCNHPAQFMGDNSVIPGRSGKLARLTEMLEEVLEVGDRALIFSQFVEMGKILKRQIEETFGSEALFLHGGVPKRRRDRMVADFQDGGPQVFILSLKAGGTGLNLTAANHVFHFDRWWNPAVENQATDRAFRIGQERNVQVHKFVCAGTLEEKIDAVIDRKKGVAEKVIGTGEGWLTELSNDEIKDVLSLSLEAAGA